MSKLSTTKKPQPDLPQVSVQEMSRMTYSGGDRYFDGNIMFCNNVNSIPGLHRKFQTKDVAFVFDIAGELSITLGGTPFTVGPNDGLFVNYNVVVTDFSYTPDFDYCMIVVNTNVGVGFTSKTIVDALMMMRHNPVIHFTPCEIELIRRYYEVGRYKIEHPGLNHSRDTMMRLLRCFTLDLVSSVNSHATEETDSSMLRQGDKLYYNFLTLLADNPRHERDVAHFAERLCVSPKYLSSVCKAKSGESASTLISKSISSQVRDLLLYSSKSIKEVAAEMGFDNLSFFGKYVKKHLGESPVNFRKSNNYGK